jgi:hypothetical protein
MAGLSGSQAYVLAKKYIEESLEGAGALKGKSAYELAVETGFEGTEEEWLDSLSGGETAKDEEVDSMLDKIFGSSEEEYPEHEDSSYSGTAKDEEVDDMLNGVFGSPEEDIVP